MNKTEFEAHVTKLLNKKNTGKSELGFDISDEDYAIVEKVYQYHPIIGDVHGKEQIACLYADGGLEAIRGLLEVAEKFLNWELEETEITRKISDLQNDLSCIAHFREELFQQYAQFRPIHPKEEKK